MRSLRADGYINTTNDNIRVTIVSVLYLTGEVIHISSIILTHHVKEQCVITLGWIFFAARSVTGSLQMTVLVSVSGGECPDASETASISQGVSAGLPCKQAEIFQLKDKTNIRWMKVNGPQDV